MRRFPLLVLLSLLLAACQGLSSTAVPGHEVETLATVPLTVAIQPTSTMPVTPPWVAPITQPSSTASVGAAATASPAEVCADGETFCILEGHFLLRRPIALSGHAAIDQTYRYGTTQAGKREPHHGVEFPNAQGTPVLAAADGRVVFAGDDKVVSLAWVPAYYGRVVVIEHHFPGLALPYFSLYAHLFAIKVSEGQQVRAGETVGQVGATGKAIGSHLHFELRAGKNDYRSNRNPELWLAPLAGMGVLAGRIEDAQGKALKGMLNVQRIENGVLNPLPVTSLETYVTKETQPVNGDDVWQENFAAGELPAGDYRLTLVYNGAIHEQVVKIAPGNLTFVSFVLK